MKKNPKWKDFECEVARLFSLKGFRAISNVQIEGRQTDVFLESDDETIGCILVECKYRESTDAAIGVEDVESFVNRVANLRADGRINSGYLVTNSTFTSQATAVAGRDRTKNFVFLRNIDEVKRGLIDFNPYLKRTIEAFSSDLTLGREYEELDAFVGFREDEINVGDVFEDFLSIDSISSVQILTADFGMGKTTSLKHLYLDLAKRYLEEPQDNKIPCFIPLKNYYHTGSPRSLINQFLCDEVGYFGRTWLSFAEMMAAGLIVLILDGFDEMTAQTNEDSRLLCFSKLADLCTKNGRVIISGRPNYFPEESAMRNAAGLLLGGNSTDSLRSILKNSLINQGDEDITVSFAKILPMDETKIRSFIYKRLLTGSSKTEGLSSKDSVDEIFKKIEKIYNLRELAERPILLEMICSSLGELESGKVSNVSDLYDLYTDAWLKVESLKGEVRAYLTSEKRLLFSIGLACAMLNEDFIKGSIHYLSLRGIVAAFFDEDEIDEIDYLSSDVQTCGFISRDREGNYSFGHRSFFEYFVARAIAINQNLRNDPVRGNVAINLMYLDRWLEYEVTSIGELRDKEPGIFSFLEGMFSFPLTELFWGQLRTVIGKVDEFINEGIGVREQIEFVEEIWDVLAFIDIDSFSLNKLSILQEKFLTLKSLLKNMVVILEEYPSKELSEELKSFLDSDPSSSNAD